MTPDVTVAVPTHSCPTLLERALRSIAAQERAPAQVIVVDDTYRTDSDETRRAVARSGLDGALVVTNTHGPGASGARNTGAEMAAGQLLAFLDDDDEWLPCYLTEALARFETDRLDLMCTDFLYAFEDGSQRPGKLAPDRPVPDIFMVRNPGCIGSNLIIGRGLYRDSGGFDESLPTLGDRDFGLRMSLRGDVRYQRLAKPLVRHYQHGGPRLCMRHGQATRAGIRRFYELHAPRMTPVQREEFRRHMLSLWGIDERGEVV